MIRVLLLLALSACSGDGDSTVKPTDDSVTRTTDSTAEPVACGPTLSCERGAVCVQENFEPVCIDRPDTAGCPDGTSESMCGGDGHPCCCEPEADPRFRCVASRGCDAEPACDCLGDVCPANKECMASADPGLFICEALAVP